MATSFTPKFTRWRNIATNATGQIPGTGSFGLIDKDTPTSVYNIPSYKDGRELALVFSDEFNEDGRTFYPGDDPYWEAVDLHYWVLPTIFPVLRLEWLNGHRQLITWNGMIPKRSPHPVVPSL